LIGKQFREALHALDLNEAVFLAIAEIIPERGADGIAIEQNDGAMPILEKVADSVAKCAFAGS
jgi:hypothetical protein